MNHLSETYDVVVCGGGMAGFCAAVAAARHGAKVCLVQDRPVLGGNASSEVRVTVHGAAQFHAYARETGILSEVLIEERSRNHESINENGWTNSVFDLALYDLAQNTPNLTVRVNTALTDIVMEGNRPAADGWKPAGQEAGGYYHRPACNVSRRIQAVVCRVANAETELTLHAAAFIDCTGDGVLGDLAGCEWRMGTESRAEFDEPHAPDDASADTMGNSIHIRARNMGRPCPFNPPDWAVKHEDASYFYDQGRNPGDPRGGFWWIEIGMPWHTIHDAETIRHELTRHALGVWDWMKNKDDRLKAKGIDNYALDWIGQTPGKRESRRIVGRYFMTEHDILNKVPHPDEIAFGGWFVDLHTPGGLLAATSEITNAEGYAPDSEYSAKSYCGPYGIPLRILIARDIDNLGMAGRNVSVTHAALGTVRVMATTALMGQALGTAAALARHKGIDLPTVVEHAREVQQLLLRDGCFLPSVRNEDPADLAQRATASASSETMLAGVGPESQGVYNGLERWGASADGEVLKNRRGQYLATTVGGQVRTLAVCLTNRSPEPQAVPAVLHAVEGIWDYRVDPGSALAQTTLIVPPGERRWVEWAVNCTPPQTLHVGGVRFVRLDLLPNPHVKWHFSRRVEPGCVAVFAISPKKMRAFFDGQSLSYRIDPPQRVYGAANVLSGVTRPHTATNLWRSDPSHPGPHWLELRWPEPVTVRQIELTFPGHLLREYHAYPPFYRDPQCPKDYVIEAMESGGRWREILRETDNYHRHRRHTLARAVITAGLRVSVIATNGDPSGAIYEVRCYA